MSRRSPLRYRGGGTKRYRCSICTRRFAAWSDVWAHTEAMHGERPLAAECDLALIEERERLAIAGIAAADLPVTLFDHSRPGASP